MYFFFTTGSPTTTGPTTTASPAATAGTAATAAAAGTAATAAAAGPAQAAPESYTSTKNQNLRLLGIAHVFMFAGIQNRAIPSLIVESTRKNSSGQCPVILIF